VDNEEAVKQAEENIQTCTTEVQATLEKLNEQDVKVQDANDKKRELENQAKDLEADLNEAKEAWRTAVNGLNKLKVLPRNYQISQVERPKRVRGRHRRGGIPGQRKSSQD